jgi:DNA-binding transcriptional regulator YdaS (Cro superfamily)
MMQETPEQALDRAVKVAGSASALARALGISPEAVMQWRQVPALRVIKVAQVTGVPKEALRPDLYPLEAAE